MADALRKQPVQIVFEQGLDTKTNPQIVPSGRLTTLENFCFGDGALRRRPGSSSAYEPNADASGIKVGADAMLAIHRGRLVVRDKTRLFPYSETTGRLLPGGVVKGGNPEAIIPPSALLLRKFRLNGSPLRVVHVNHATLNGVRVTTWGQNNATMYLQAMAVDENGTVLLPPTNVSAAASFINGPRLVSMVDRVGLFYMGDTLKVRFLKTDTPYALDEEIGVDASASYNVIDAAPLADGNALVGGISEDGSHVRTVRAFRVSSAGVKLNSLALNTYAQALAPPRSGGYFDSLGVTQSRDGNVFIVYAVLDGSGHLTLRGAVRNSTLGTVVTAEAEIADLIDFIASASQPTISIAPGPTDDTAYLVVEILMAGYGSDTQRRMFYGVLGKDLSWAPSTWVDGALVSKPFRMGNSEMMFALESPATISTAFGSEGVSSQRSLLVVNHRSFIVARLDAGTAINSNQRYPGNVYVRQTDGRWSASLALAARGQISAGERTVVENVTLTEDVVTKSKANRLVPVEYGGSLYFPGAITRQFDGRFFFETGWNSYADLFTVTAGAGTLAAGQWLCAIVPEWLDASGELHQAAPILQAVTLSTAGGVSWLLKDEPYTDRPSVTYALYRSDAPGSTTLFRLKAQAIYGTTVTESETGIDSGPYLYTTGDVLPGLPPPPCTHLSVHDGRLGAVSAEDGQLYFSTKYIPGYAPRFHPFFVIRTTGRNGAIVASASQPGRWVLLEEHGIEYVTGDGPNETGAGGTFSEPQNIPSPTGCKNTQSVVSMPLGIMFQGEKGFWLLGNDLSLQYLGEPVEGFVGTVTCAIHIPEKHEVRFGQSSPDLSLVFHYLKGQWSTNGRRVAVSAVAWNGRATWADNLVTGQTSIYQEDPEAVSDNGTPIRSVVETAWFRVGGLHGFQRVWWVSLLGTHRGDCLLTLEIGYDDEPEYSEQVVQHYTSDEDAVPGRPLFVRHKPENQKCRSIRFRVTCDGGGDGPSGGVDLTSIGLEMGVKPGVFRASELKTLGPGS